MRLTWIAAAIIVASSSAQANTELEQQLSICAIKADKLERLICYDDVAATVQLTNQNDATVATAVTKSVTTTDAPIVKPSQAAASIAVSVPVATTQVPDESFGLQKKVAEDEIEKLYFNVADVDKDPYGALIITLANGQIWKQSQSDRYKVNKGQKIYIKKGALSSFLLGTDDRNSTTRVKRIK
ncbi:hypothetical protein ACRWQL_08300 [Shewanella sp. HL-SH4]|uniref:hypothetical protein n=1 Tax=Shewanella sp. HL-SH4 TaxID=3436240 RepID=UPI003EBA052E